MGTAPDDRQESAIPLPADVLAGCVAMFISQGLTERQAVARVASVTGHAITYAKSFGIVITPWLDEIAALARGRLESLPPSNDDHSGVEHGDGPGSRAGRQEENRHR